jgi:hypothetical protein
MRASVGKLRLQPCAHVVNLPADEGFVAERRCEGGDALASHQDMQGQRIGIGFTAERRELPCQPVAEQGEELGGVALRDMIEFRKLVAERADRTAIGDNLRLVHDENADEAADTVCRIGVRCLPCIDHRLSHRETLGDHRLENLVFGLEVIVEIPARKPDRRRNGGKRGRFEPSLVEETIRGCYDFLAGFCRAHLVASSSGLPGANDVSRL